MPAPDPRRFPIPKLAMLLNSTPLGTVTSASKLRRCREQGGYAISTDGETLDLLRFAAWLCVRRHTPPAVPQAPKGDVDPLQAYLEQQRAELANALPM